MSAVSSGIQRSLPCGFGVLINRLEHPVINAGDVRPVSPPAFYLPAMSARRTDSMRRSLIAVKQSLSSA